MAVAWTVLATALAVAGPAAEGAPTSPAWSALPRAPIPGRIAASVVWTGREVIVWGGVHGTPRADGAAYDPAARTWRRIAPAPSGVLGGGGGAAAWTGRDMLVWAGNSPGGPAGGALYDPRTDTWRRLPPGPLGPREGYVSVWTGRELLVFGGSAGDTIATPTAAALDPRTGAWRRLRSFDALGGLLPGGAVWNGRTVFLLGTVYPHGRRAGHAIFLSYDPARGTIHRLELAGAPASPGRRPARPLAWTGTEVLLSASADPLFSSTALSLYDPATGRWRAASAAPCALPANAYTQVAWIGDRLVAACGVRGLQLYSPRTDTWRTIDAGPSPLNARGWGAIAWTGRELIAWSGTVRKPHNPTPASGASIALAAGTAPIALGPAADGTTVTPRVGDTLVVRLPGNPTTGYRWLVAHVPPPLRLVSTSYAPAPPGRLGQGGTFTFRFAVRAGSGTLRLEYRRPWERQTPPLRTFAVGVRAR